MTTFLILAALLTILALSPLVYVLLKPDTAETLDDPNSKKRQALAAARAAGVIDQAEYDQKLNALKADQPAPAAPARVAPARQLALVLTVLVPLGMLGLYRQFGNALALDPANLVAADGSASGGDNTPPPSLESAVQSLEQKMAANPEDMEGWRLLARGKQSMQDFAGSLTALQKARDLAPDNLDVQVEYAEALALAGAERRITGEPLRLLEDALSRDGAHQRALWLLGIAAVQRGDKPAAIDYWKRLQAQLPPESEIRQSIEQQLAELTGETVAPSAVAASDAPAVANTGASIRVKVSLNDALRARVGPNAVLYVFARPAEGPKMPLAIQRLPVSVLPVDLTLDDSMGMMPTMKLSGTPQIVIGARISQSGVANAQSGDLEGLTPTLTQANIDGPIEITISEVVP
ncbi:hypothetical protein C7S18_07630 [Ahniella affigens]|uniref:Uncharacterized protein n=1 Tax=Ahniella affigens TaxID=2021234 RepID=A0A2P1PQE9_9GAMM|nr:hypothetical protein [Ahniella affigens]AVP97070.1 hypothetical protein C7S18_07630 [Ahniella affigens]